MLRVKLILPDDRQGEIEIDENSRIRDIKDAIVSDLNLGNAEDYMLAVADKDQSAIIKHIKIQEGDLLILISSKKTKPKPARIDPNNFLK